MAKKKPPATLRDAHIEVETRATRLSHGLDPDTCLPRFLPCPFCGDKRPPLLHRNLRDGYEKFKDDPDAYAYFYSCSSCACHGGWAKSETGAVRWWNMRTK